MQFQKAFQIILACSILSPLFAFQSDQIFEQANQYYQNSEFELAVENYESILQSGFESGELYFNLGNAYYKIGLLGKARINYERALIWMEGDGDLTHNLEMLKLRLVDQIEPPPQLFINVWWNYLVDLFQTHIWGYIVLFMFWILLIIAAVYLHYRRRGKIKMKGLLVTISIIWLFVMSIWVNKIYLFETENYGIILKSSVTVYAEPVKETTELFVIHEGTRVKVERFNEGWLEIRLEDGKTGWLMEENLEVI